MNKSYKTIWNESLGAWVAASELATGRSKSSRSRKATRAVLAAGLLLQAGVMAPAVAGALDGGSINNNNQLAYLSKASNANAVAVGPNAKASGATSAALGGNSAASGDQSVALGANANASAFGASALGVNSNAIGGSATALGNSASAAGNSAVALGESAKTSSNFALAAGASSNASGLQSVAVGYLSKASNTNAVAVGAGANAAGSSGVSVGANSAARLDNAVAVGNNANAAGSNSSALGNASAASGADALAAGASSTASGAQSVAVGINSKASNTSALALGNNALASGTQSIAIGNGAQATGTQSLSVGTGNKVSGNNSGAFGDPNTVTGAGSYAFGNNNTIAADRAFVMGNNVSVGASLTGAVVLGDGSAAAAAQATTGTTINGIGYAFAGTTPTSTVSVGAVGAERQITNVAAGRLSNTSTDAVNGSQLFATNLAVNKLVINGAPTKYFKVNSVEADSVAAGAESVAIGPKALANSSNSIAMGNNANANLLPEAHEIKDLKALGFFDDDLEVVARAMACPAGLILITGPTGSGKSSTLHAGLRMQHLIERNVLTVEDPLEYRVPLAGQTEVNRRAGYDFGVALRHFLRHDPDVILVGEMRDAETAQAAVDAAATGHLVLSTLHVTTVFGVVPRLAPFGLVPQVIAENLKLVINQRLVRKLCSHCSVTDPFSDTECTWLGVAQGTLGRRRLGCARCRNTGFHGRLPLYELLAVDERMANAIADGAGRESIRTLAQKQGFQHISLLAKRRVRHGQTTVEEVRRVIGDEAGI